MVKGIGRLITETQVPPVVVPIVHQGLESIIPLGTYIPIPGKKVEKKWREINKRYLLLLGIQLSLEIW